MCFGKWGGGGEGEGEKGARVSRPSPLLSSYPFKEMLVLLCRRRRIFPREEGERTKKRKEKTRQVRISFLMLFLPSPGAELPKMCKEKKTKEIFVSPLFFLFCSPLCGKPFMGQRKTRESCLLLPRLIFSSFPWCHHSSTFYVHHVQGGERRRESLLLRSWLPMIINGYVIGDVTAFSFP